MTDEMLPPLPDDEPQLQQHVVEDAFAGGIEVAFKFGFVGIGEGGGRIAETFYQLGYRRVCVMNSASSDLQSLDDKIRRLDFRTNGAGQDMAKGKKFVLDRKEEIYDLITGAMPAAPDFLMICASLGGGTGSGGCGEVVKLARKFMATNGKDPKRVGVVVSLPNPYEGQKTCDNAVQAFKELETLDPMPTPFLIIDNKRTEELYKVASTALYQTCNKQVAHVLHHFNHLASCRSELITFDAADFAKLLDAGISIFGLSQVREYKQKQQISEQVRETLGKTVLAEVDLHESSCAGCIFVGHKDILDTIPLDYFGHSFGMLNRVLSDEATIFRGVYIGQRDDLRCYAMISGLPRPGARLRELSNNGLTQSRVGGIAEWLGVDDSAP